MNIKSDENRIIRYWTSHDNKSPEYWAEWFSLPAQYKFVFDARSPEFLLATEHIYSQRRRFKEFMRLNDGDRISVFIGGEAISPDMNIFDYACSFDRGVYVGERHIRKPPVMFFRNHVFSPLTSGCNDAEAVLNRKSGFCNFIYSNPKAHPRRDQLFFLLNQYKKVDALGPHLNNKGNATSRTATDWRQGLVEMKRPYKFSIAAENACFDGYVTEKLISSFQARTIPIYWGDPSVAEEFNQKAFINANNMSDSELLEEVKRIDSDDEVWCDMISQPAMTMEQDAMLKRDMEAFSDFFSILFDSRRCSAKKRVPRGFWNDIYRQALSGCALTRWLGSRNW